MDRCFFFVLFIRLFFFFLLENLCLQRTGGHPLGPPFFFSPSLFSFLSLHCFLLISFLHSFHPSLNFSSVAFSREILLMFIAGSTYAEANASTGRPVNCPMKINMVLFFFVETYPPKFKHVLAEARRVRFSVRSRTTFCLPPVFRSTIASLRSAIILFLSSYNSVLFSPYWKCFGKLCSFHFKPLGCSSYQILQFWNKIC